MCLTRVFALEPVAQRDRAYTCLTKVFTLGDRAKTKVAYKCSTMVYTFEVKGTGAEVSNKEHTRV